MISFNFINQGAHLFFLHQCRNKLAKIKQLFQEYKQGVDNLDKLLPTKTQRDQQILKNFRNAFKQSHMNQFLQAELHQNKSCPE
jgi:hypothetical protein